MPNGGVTPDCAHCKHLTGDAFSSDGTMPTCELHTMTLPVPIRAFCAARTDPEPQEQEQVDWLDVELDRTSLRSGMMYLWLDMQGKPFTHVEFALISDYAKWQTRQRWYEEFGKIVEKYRD